VVGNPAERKGEVSDEMIAHKTEGTALYQGLPADAHLHLTEVDALTSVPANRVEDFPSYDTWAERKDQGGSPEE